MKKCIECDNEVEELAHVCPKCGSKSFIGSYSAEDALSALDTIKHQSEAAQHVDESAKLYMAGRFEEAKRELETALKLNPMSPTAHGNMGAVLLKQGKANEAIPWLEKALQLNPNLEGIPQALAEAKSAAKSDDSKCFIATACYNDSECEEIIMLREFRDNVLLKNLLGQLFIKTYYILSPKIADFIKQKQTLRLVIKDYILNPVVSQIKRFGA